MKLETADNRPLLSAVRLMRPDFLPVVYLSACINVLMLVPSVYVLQLFDRVMVSGNLMTLLAVTLITLFLLLLMGVADWLRTRQLVRISQRFEEMLGSRIFDSAMKARLVAGARCAESALSDLDEFRQFLSGNGIFTVCDLPWFPLYVLVMFLIHPAFGALAIAGASILILLAYNHHLRSGEGIAKAQESFRQEQEFLHGKMKNEDLIEVLGMHESLRDRWLQRHRNHREWSMKLQRMANQSGAVTKFFRYSFQSLSLGLGALLVIHDQLSVGSMIVGNMLIVRTLQPIETFVGSWRSFLSARACFERLERLLADFSDSTVSVKRIDHIGTLTLTNVAAWTPGRRHRILAPLSLRFESGQVTVIVGPSGSGKSTLARIIANVWPEIDGDVHVDGSMRADFDPHFLGRRLGYVPQDVELFDGSIAANIARFGEVQAAEVIRAARAAHLHEIILRLPDGYDTKIGNAGSRLSGGLRQRIALARALYGDPDLIVLDEPNSNLDDAGNKALAMALRHLKAAGKCVVVVSHRSDLLALADRILLVQAGALAFSGAPEALLAARQGRQTRIPDETAECC